MTDWERPKTLAFPTVWVTFHGINENNGVKRKYWIQDLTDTYYHEVIYYMSTGFLCETPLCKYSNFTEDPQSVQDYVAVWKKMLDQHLTLICLTKDENGETRLVGCNVLGISHKNEKLDLDEILKGRASRIAGGALLYVYGIRDVFFELNIDAYLSAFGLYVLPEYRGEGIGYQLLKARREISLAVGIEVSVTAFTSLGGQRLAEKLGFKDIIEFPYADLEKVNPLFKFPGIEADATKALRVMYIRYNE